MLQRVAAVAAAGLRASRGWVAAWAPVSHGDQAQPEPAGRTRGAPDADGDKKPRPGILEARAWPSRTHRRSSPAAVGGAGGRHAGHVLRAGDPASVGSDERSAPAAA